LFRLTEYLNLEKTIRMSSFSAVLIALCAWPTLFQWTPVGAANILAVQPIAGKSHWNVVRAVLRALTDRGHNVTVFTPFVDGDRPGYTEVDVSEKASMFFAIDATFLIQKFSSRKKTLWSMANYTRRSCDMIYGDQRMVDILDGVATRQFDLVVTEPLGSDCVAYAATVLRVPLVYVVAFPIITFMERSLTGHTPNPASTAHVLSSYSTPKTFAERFVNVVLTVYCSALKWYSELQLKLANHRAYDSADLIKPSLIFINSHFTTDPARPLTPDLVPIGGIHLAPPKPIPEVIHIGLCLRCTCRCVFWRVSGVPVTSSSKIGLLVLCS